MGRRFGPSDRADLLNSVNPRIHVGMWLIGASCVLGALYLRSFWFLGAGIIVRVATAAQFARIDHDRRFRSSGFSVWDNWVVGLRALAFSMQRMGTPRWVVWLIATTYVVAGSFGVLRLTEIDL